MLRRRAQLYTRNLGFNVLAAPVDFSIANQPIDIYSYFCNHANQIKKFIFSVSDSTTSTTLTAYSGVSYIYGEDSGSGVVETAITSGTITWIVGSSKRFVICLKSTSIVNAINIPTAVWLYIGNGVSYFSFATNSTLNYVHVSNSTQLTYVGGNNSAITGTLFIPLHMTTLGTSRFQGNNKLTELVLNNVAVIGAQAFYLCSGFVGALNISSKVTSIGAAAFGGCTGFTALNLPQGYNLAYNTFNFSNNFSATSLNQSIFNLADNYGTFTIGTTNKNRLTAAYPNAVTDAAARGITIS